jgi:hypothetical protein
MRRGKNKPAERPRTKNFPSSRNTGPIWRPAQKTKRTTINMLNSVRTKGTTLDMLGGVRTTRTPIDVLSGVRGQRGCLKDVQSKQGRVKARQPASDGSWPIWRIGIFWGICPLICQGEARGRVVIPAHIG